MSNGDVGWSAFAILMLLSGLCVVYHLLEQVHDCMGPLVTPVIGTPVTGDTNVDMVNVESGRPIEQQEQRGVVGSVLLGANANRVTPHPESNYPFYYDEESLSVN